MTVALATNRVIGGPNDGLRAINGIEFLWAAALEMRFPDLAWSVSRERRLMCQKAKVLQNYRSGRLKHSIFSFLSCPSRVFLF
jgi:hypothetical protein